MDVQLCECAKTPLIIYLKGWILYYINYELYLKLILKKKKKKETI